MTLGWLLLGLFFQATGNGSIEGIVVRSGTSDPLSGVLVALTNADASIEMRDSIPVATTDTAGRFKFSNLTAGSYRLLFSANGYVRQEYGQRTFPGNGTQVAVTPGRSVRDLVVRMTPAGAVTGRILDRNGRPLVAVPVRLMRYLYDETGLKTLRPYGTAQTDDRGEYRIYFVTPGRYYLHAGSAQGPGGYGGPSRGPNEAALSYTTAYYPGVADVKTASIIDVQPGTVWSGIDMTLARQTLYRVSGRVIDAVTGQPPAAPAIWLFHFDPAIARSAAIRGDANTGAFTYDRGRFEFRGVFPGPYTLAASERPNTAGNQRAMRLGFVHLEVGGSDVEGVVVTIPPGASISGRIVLEGQAVPASAFYDGAGFVSLTRTPDPNHPTMPRDWEAGARFADDGSFQLNGITIGEYRVSLPQLTPGFYIKEIRYGLTDALARPFQFNPGQPARLEILLSQRVAQVNGVVFNARSEPVSGAQVVLIPNDSRDRAELFKGTTTDQDGRFTIRNAAPGQYRILAWETIEPWLWFDPDILKRDEPFSMPLQLSESGSATVSLSVVPAR
jgi:5-hydroxyisourate hydrolase-like protein (transthyretin family)